MTALLMRKLSLIIASISSYAIAPSSYWSDSRATSFLLFLVILIHNKLLQQKVEQNTKL
jgi:hypothetical protein